MTLRGCSIIFINDQEEILLFLRDDIPDIPYPNMWDIPGGHVEEGETPEECIVREMKEEIGLDIDGFNLFSVIEFAERTEHTFWKKENLDISPIILTEGQCLKWFTGEEAKKTRLANGFNQVIEDFFKTAPFLK